MIITFVKDVTLASEPEGTGPHYRKGYCVDASPDFACAQVAEGNAVHGLVKEPEAEASAEPIEPVYAPAPEPEEVKEEDLPPMPVKRKTRWKPHD